MPYNQISPPIQDDPVQVFLPTGGNPTGARISMIAPYRGYMKEAGFMPNSLVASAITLAIAIGSQTSSTASTFTQVVDSVRGTFSSTVLMEGAPCSVTPLSPCPVNAGDAVQFTTSGGNSSAIGVTCYAIFRRG